jgi:hypothetical protein
VCFLGIGVLIGLAWSERWPTPGLADGHLASARAPVVVAHQAP